MESNGAPVRCKYPVFISYSHRDERWASWLHKAIEAYRVPNPWWADQGGTARFHDRVSPCFETGTSSPPRLTFHQSCATRSLNPPT
jgi:hypothetical protein